MGWCGSSCLFAMFPAWFPCYGSSCLWYPVIMVAKDIRLHSISQETTGPQDIARCVIMSHCNWIFCILSQSILLNRSTVWHSSSMPSSKWCICPLEWRDWCPTTNIGDASTSVMWTVGSIKCILQWQLFLMTYTRNACSVLVSAKFPGVPS